MRIRTGLVLAVLLALAVAACGKKPDGDGIATAGTPGAKGTTSPTPDGLTDSDRMLKYAQCMRDNGVPNFPDPEMDGGNFKLELPDGADPAAVDAAQEKCKRFLPNGGQPRKLDPQQLDQIRKFAQCMRDNGVPKFPDPDENGGIRIEGGPGLDPQSELFKAAEQKCQQYQPAPKPGEPSPGTETRTG